MILFWLVTNPSDEMLAVFTQKSDSAKLTLPSAALRAEQSCCFLLWESGWQKRRKVVWKNCQRPIWRVSRDHAKLAMLCVTNWTSYEFLLRCPGQSFLDTPDEGNVTTCADFLNVSLNQNHSYLPRSSLPSHTWCPGLSASVGNFRCDTKLDKV